MKNYVVTVERGLEISIEASSPEDAMQEAVEMGYSYVAEAVEE